MKYSQNRLALDSGLDKNTISNVIRAGRRGSWRTVETAERLRAYLGLKTLEEILVDSEVDPREDEVNKDVKAMNDGLKPAPEYWHGAGSFKRNGDRWIEYPALPDGRHFEFRDMGVQGEFLYLVDEGRLRDERSAMYVRLPIRGGIAQWSFPNPLEWKDLYVVKRGNGRPRQEAKRPSRSARKKKRK